MHSRRRERNTQFSLKFCRNRIFATNEWICIKNRQREFAAKKSGFSRNHRFYRILRCHRESNTEACHPALKTMTAKLYRKLLKFRRNRIFATNEWICIKNRQRGFAAKKKSGFVSMHWSMHSRRRGRKHNFRWNSAETEFSQQTNGFALKLDKGISQRKNPEFLGALLHALPPPPGKGSSRHGPPKKTTIFAEILPKPNFRNKRMDLH